MSLSTITSVTDWLLTPIPPFTWFGLTLSTFDVGATLRLCVVLRQLREIYLKAHRQQQTQGKDKVEVKNVEDYSLVKNIATALVVVYGGEAAMAPWLGISPSFLYSPTIPLLYAGLTVLTEHLPWVPEFSLSTELPLTPFDGLTRAFLLCQLIPPVVTKHIKPEFSSSPWTLLLSSFIIANGGFFFVNLFSMLHPTGFTVSTPAELRAYGWTTMDLWCAPVITSIYALLTHAQPFWADLHRMLVSLGVGVPYATTIVETTLADLSEKIPSVEVAPLSHEDARAICAILLGVMFAARTVRNFGPEFIKSWKGEKKRVMRSRIDGKRYNGPAKTKTQ